jgi:hypothetical protein
MPPFLALAQAYYLFIFRGSCKIIESSLIQVGFGLPKASFFSGTLRQLPSPAGMAPFFQIKGAATSSPPRN